MTPATAACWLMKSEPGSFSIDDLKRKRREPWDGVRNYQARNFMRDGMRPGDRVFFYHSNCAVPGIVGIAEVATDAYPDPTQFDPQSKYFDPGSTRGKPRWMLVDVKFVRKLKRTISLDELKQHAALADMALLHKGNRLSVMPVDHAHWQYILGLEAAAGAKPTHTSSASTEPTHGPRQRKTPGR
jgi:predicted RNA-binding protein with PUA-like domain